MKRDHKRGSADRGNTGSNRGQYKQSQHAHNNPRRGAAGILLTCDTGREAKARREGLAILQQDWEQNYVATPSIPSYIAESHDNAHRSEPTTKPSSDSLDTELEQLRRTGTSTIAPSFAVYETGCKGTVLILCTAGRLIVPPRSKSDTGGVEPNPPKKPKLDTLAEDAAASPPSVTEDKTNEEAQASNGDLTHGSIQTSAACVSVSRADWDPFDVVRRVVQDMENGANTLTSSRFITRMIPMQASCYTSIEDIQHAVEKLLEPIVAIQAKQSPTASSASSGVARVPTFAVQEKRRFCSHIKHDQIVDAIGAVVDRVTNAGWKVNLTSPDYTLWIEVCKNVTGVSVVPLHDLKPKNFNLAEFRDSLAAAAAAVELPE
jgi:tRNA acetyltransferase TAN1